MKRICNIEGLRIHSILSLPTVRPIQVLTDKENMYYELVYYFSGSDKSEFRGWTDISTADTVRFLPKKGAGEKYIITNIEPVESVDIFFETDTPLPNEPISIKVSDGNELRSMFKKAEAAWRKKDVGYMNDCISLFYRILCLIEKGCNGGLTASARQLEPAMKYIHSHYTDPAFPYSEMAERCGMSESYFRRLFRRQYGCSLTSYVRELRLNYAAEMLSSAEHITVSEAAAACGYEDIFYFSKIFKQTVGVSPRDCRRKRR